MADDIPILPTVPDDDNEPRARPRRLQRTRPQSIGDALDQRAEDRPSQRPRHEAGGLSGPAIAGIVGGVLVGLGGIAAAVYFAVKQPAAAPPAVGQNQFGAPPDARQMEAAMKA
jgi:hypothetical protein